MSLLLAAATALFLFLSPSPDGGWHPCPGTGSSPLGAVDATLVNACPPKSPRMSCGCRALIGLSGDLRATASISSEIISHLAGPLGPWSPGSRAAGFPLGVSGGPIPISPSPPHLGFKEKALHGFQEGRGHLHICRCRDDCACAHPESRYHFYGPNDGASSFSVVAAHSRALQVARSLTHHARSPVLSHSHPLLLLLLLPVAL